MIQNLRIIWLQLTDMSTVNENTQETDIELYICCTYDQIKVRPVHTDIVHECSW